MLNNPKRNPGEDLDFKNVSPMGSLSITNKIIMPIVCCKSIFIVYNGNSCVNISPKTFHWGNVWNFLERYPFGDSSFPPILAIFIVVVENYRAGYVFRGALNPPPSPWWVLSPHKIPDLFLVPVGQDYVPIAQTQLYPSPSCCIPPTSIPSLTCQHHHCFCSALYVLTLSL